MKIVHVNATDRRGGAAIAMMRHNEALCRAGYDSQIVVANGYSGIYRILRSLYYRINIKKENALNSKANFSLMNYGMPIHKHPKVREADVIFLHWVCANSLSIDGVEKILKLGKPTFWYMHDMFPFTGGCHYALDCNGYIKDCSNCPQIQNQTYKGVASKQLLSKIAHWGKYSNLEFISPSTWEADCARKSTICQGHEIHIAPNVIDTDVYHPIESTKEKYGLNPNKKTILFGATRINSPYKGAQFAHDCLKLLDPNKYEGLVIGNADTDFISDLPIKVVQTGFLYNDEDIVRAYNACDTFIMTSIAESFGQVVAEAMACGKPCVGFPTGGVTDLIKHKDNGYLTSTINAYELKNGLDYIFEDQRRYNSLSYQSRRLIELYFSYNNISSIHNELIPYL